MTISTRHTKSRDARRVANRAFTLTELMVSATLSLLVLAGVMSSFLMIGRSGFLASSYAELERETRRGLETFGNDARKAVDVQWNSSQSITLKLPTASNATTLVTYFFERDSRTAATGTFYRLVGDADSTLPRLALVHRVAPDFAFQRFKLEQPGVDDNTARNDLETKQIQIALRASRSGATTIAANQSALSACYVLRNKRVSN